MKGAGGKGIIGGWIFGRGIIIRGVLFIFFPGNHETVICNFRDFNSQETFSVTSVIGKVSQRGCLLWKTGGRCDGKINVVRNAGIIRYIVIFTLVNGGSDTQYVVGRNSHTVYACVAGQCPDRGTGTAVGQKLNGLFLKSGAVISGKLGAAWAFALFQDIQIGWIGFNVLGKGVP